MLIRYLMLILVIMGTGCARENLPIAGGELAGDLATPPSDWTELASAEIIQLETRPGDPYSVNLWIFGNADAAYVYAGENQATWVENLQANPDARLRVGGTIYPVVAERVTEQAEFKIFAQAWHAKYGSDGPMESSVTQAYLYRLTAPAE